jgi:phage recombination protein Bet
MNEVTTRIQPSRMPIPLSVAKEFSLEPTEWRVLVEQIFPAAKSPEAVMMALAYCRKRELDIFKKPVHIVPMWSSALNRMVETVWPGIAEIRTTASRTGEYAGIDAVEFGPEIGRTFKGAVGRNSDQEIEKTVRYPEWASVVVYRMVRGVRCPYHAKVYWEETYASIGKTEVPNEMWAKRPRGQLDKCVEAAALRKAFPEELGNTYAAEEMEGRTIDHEDAAVAVPKSPKPPPVPTSVNGDDNDPVDIEATEPAADAVDPETGEIVKDQQKLLPPAESAALKTGLLKRLGTCGTTTAVTEWHKSADVSLPTMQPEDRAEVEEQRDALLAELFDREQVIED